MVRHRRVSPKGLALLGLVFSSFLAPAAAGQVSHGTVQEGLTIDSKILGRPVRYTVYLPFDYATSSRYYPVVYLLHGFSDNDMGWMQFGEAHLIADEAIAARKIPPMILVMPDAGVSWYVNSHDGAVRYEDFFFQEFMPAIEAAYRIRAEKRYRGVAGLSMGGFGTLMYALRHPELFAAAAPFSAGVFTDEEATAMPRENWAFVLGPVFGADRAGADRLTDHFRANNPLDLLKTMDREQARSVRWYLDCGDDDFLYKGNAALHVLLRDLEIPHEFRVRDGGHTWSYWRTGLADALAFIGTSFHQP